MKTILFIFGSYICLQVVMGGDTKAECQKRVTSVLKKLFMGNTACENEMESHKLSKEKFMEQRGCLAKCTLKKANILHDESQMVTEAMVKAVVIENVHPDFKEKASTTIIKCLHDHNADNMDPKDPMCKGYGDLKQCIQDSLADVCGEPPKF